MSFAFLAVASALATSAPHSDPAASNAAPAVSEPSSSAGANAPANDVSVEVATAVPDVQPAPIEEPLRFDTGLRPIVTLPENQYAKAGAAKGATLIKVTSPASSGVTRRFGAVSDLQDRVQLIADQYDAAEWRPVAMDGGGGGVQYRLKFGAKETP